MGIADFCLKTIMAIRLFIEGNRSRPKSPTKIAGAVALCNVRVECSECLCGS